MKEVIIRLLEKEKSRLEREWSHLSYTPEPLMDIYAKLAELKKES